MSERTNRPNQQGRVQRSDYGAQSSGRAQGSPSSQSGGRVQVRMNSGQLPARQSASQQRGSQQYASQQGTGQQRGSQPRGGQQRGNQQQVSQERTGQSSMRAYSRQASSNGQTSSLKQRQTPPQGASRQNVARQNAPRQNASYQNSSRQNSSRQYASYQNAQPVKGSKKKIGIVIALVVVLALLIATLVYFLVIRKGSETTSTPQTEQIEATVDAKSGYHSTKLDGATETIDANGIVHGTTPSGIKYTVVGRGETTSPTGATGKVSLVAAGDVVSANWCLQICDRYAGVEGDGLYDYVPYYQEVAPFIQQYNLRYINQETTMDGAPYTGYPIFNSPDACADGMAEVGFNLVNLATNHAYDHEAAGIESTHAVFDKYPQIVTGGSYLTQEDRDTVHMIERDGVTFAYLAYTGCDNMYGIEPDNPYRPNDYYLCIFDKDKMKKEIANAKQVADVVIVSMHWGEEYTTELSEQQLEYAQFLVDQDVDLVIGSHAHILQPITMYTSASGKKIPVVFGLSDFISGWTLVETITSGLFTCDFVYNSKGVTVENCAFYPCIEWSDGGDVYVRMLKDMSDEELAANTRNDNTDDIVSYVNGILDSIKFDVTVYR